MAEDVPFYYPGIDRRSAMALLRTEGTHGSYLIRDSQSMPGSFVLSFRVDPFVRNFTIVSQVRATCIYYIIGNRRFASLSDIVRHYSKEPLSDNFCLGDPVITSNSSQSPPSPPAHSTGGAMTTHSTRIRCYDYPSVMLQQEGYGASRQVQRSTALAPAASVASPKSSSQSARPTTLQAPVPIHVPSLTASNVPTPPVPLTPNITDHFSLPSTDPTQSPASPPQKTLPPTPNAIPFPQLMEDPKLRREFEEWLKTERLEENVLFLTACRQYKQAVEKAIHHGAAYSGQQALRQAQEMAREIFIKYMTPASMYEVNISMQTVKAARKALDRASNCSHLERASKLLGVFDDAYQQIYDMLGRDVYARYLER